MPRRASATVLFSSIISACTPSAAPVTNAGSRPDSGAPIERFQLQHSLGVGSSSTARARAEICVANRECAPLNATAPAGCRAHCVGPKERGPAPGPMRNAHAKLTGPTSCMNCHEGGTGTSRSKCAACHPLDERSPSYDFHRRVTKSECASCHTEHDERMHCELACPP
jgi:hypothetical protein